MLPVATGAIVARHDVSDKLATDFAHEAQVRIALHIPIGGLARVGVLERDAKCAVYELDDNVVTIKSHGVDVMHGGLHLGNRGN